MTSEVPIEDLKKFMLESNKIERKEGLNPNDLVIVDEVCKGGINSLIHLKDIHQRITEHLDIDWGGKWRTIGVSVGSYSPPSWPEIPEMMLQFWNNFDKMDSWETHNRFESIHPFQDFNGRMGRLIWLSKAIHEGYKFNISFLHLYYYQTLRKYEDKLNNF